jgi:hypothetical protein
VEVLELLASRPDEHVAHEESMVGASADNANVDAVALVPAGETIDNVDAVAGVEVVYGTLAVDTPDLFKGLSVVSSDYLSFSSACESGGEPGQGPLPTTPDGSSPRARSTGDCGVGFRLGSM